MLITISSKLQPAELMDKILEQATLEGFVYTGVFDFKPFIIHRRDMRFQLRKRSYRYPIFPIFYGEIGHAGGGSEIRGKFQMNWAGQIIGPFWLGVSGLGVLGTLIKIIQNDLPKEFPVFIPFALLFFGFGLLKFNKTVRQDHEQIILRYMRSCAGKG